MIGHPANFITHTGAHTLKVYEMPISKHNVVAASAGVLHIRATVSKTLMTQRVKQGQRTRRCYWDRGRAWQMDENETMTAIRTLDAGKGMIAVHRIHL